MTTGKLLVALIKTRKAGKPNEIKRKIYSLEIKIQGVSCENREITLGRNFSPEMASEEN